MQSVTVRPRPTANDDAVRRVAAKRTLDMLIKEGWFSGDEPQDDDDRKVLETDLVMCLRTWGNGYEVAKNLEDRGWDPDAQLVDLLDANPLDDALREAVQAWVLEQGITPKLKVGDVARIKVNWPPRNAPPSPDGFYEGVIERVEEKTAEYIVRVAEHGHGPGGGYVLPFERVEQEA